MDTRRFFQVVVALAAILVQPTVASAQDCETRGRLEVCPHTDDDGTRTYRVTALANASYNDILDFANEGVEDVRRHLTPSQFDDANAPYVIYYCRGTTLCGGDGICRNGVSRLVNGDDAPRHYDNVCDGSGELPTRGLIAGVVYTVPAHRALTSSERNADAARTLIETETPALADIRLAAVTARDAGRDLEHPPSALGLADTMDAIVSAVDRIAPGAADAAAGEESPEVPSTALAAANARIAELEAANVALASEHDAVGTSVTSEATLPWMSIIVMCLVLASITFLFGRWTVRGRIINMQPQDLVTAKNEAREVFEQELGGTIESVKRKVADLTRDLEKAKNQVQPVIDTELAELRKTFKRLLGMDLTVKNLDGYLTQANTFTSLWTEPLKGMTPGQLKDEREQAKFARQLRDEWTTMPRLDLKFTVENLAKVLARWVRLQDLEKAWGGLTPAFALTGDHDGGLSAYASKATSDWSAEKLDLTLKFSAERTKFEHRTGELEGDVAAKRARIYELEEKLDARNSLEAALKAPVDEVVMETTKLLDGKLTPLLDDLQRGEFGPLTEGTTRYKSVDVDLVKVRFRIGKSGPSDAVRAFLQKQLDGLNRIRATLDELVGRTPSGEGFLEGLEDEAETSERPLESEPTRMVKNPLNPVVPPAAPLPDLPTEGTYPFARNPLEAAKLEAERVGSNGSNGSSDEAAAGVPHEREDEGRPRRPTMRGVGFDPDDADGDEPEAE